MSGEHLQTVLDGYAKFLHGKALALPKHQPYPMRWVRDFLLFAQGHGGYTFEQALDTFLAGLCRRAVDGTCARGDAQPGSPILSHRSWNCSTQ